MDKKIALAWTLLIAFASLSAAENSSTLFSIDDYDVSKEEFLYVYEKNNPNDADLYSEENVMEYLDLFINFKLKVQEAKALGIDTSDSFLNDFESYRQELARPYLTDEDVLSRLVREAWERSREEVRASHILIRLDEDASAEDTLAAREKLYDIKQKYEEGTPFDELAVEYSEDPSAEQNKGDLGFFTVFDMTYPFESMAYKLDEGAVSEPFRTDFGYHLVKVHEKRPFRGEMEVAHLMIAPDNRGITGDSAEALALNLYDKLMQGRSFEELVMEHSDDQFSRQRGGRMQPFGENARNLPEPFRDAVFDLEEDSAVSRPFQTSYGWHIVKRIQLHEPGTFENMHQELERRVQNDDRSAITEKAAIQSIKEEHGFSERRWPFLWLNSAIGLNEDLLDGEWEYHGKKNFRTGRRMFTIGDREYSRHNFAEYIREHQEGGKYKDPDVAVQSYYRSFKDKAVMEYQNQNLEENYPEFRNVIQEYKDGLLLFEVMNEKVWQRASEDTSGLKAYYEENKENYLRTGPVAHTYRYTLNEKHDNVLAKAESRNIEEFRSALSSREIEKSVSRSHKDLNEWRELTGEEDWHEGAIYIGSGQNNEKVDIYLIEEIKDAYIPELSSIRGRVVSDYQDYLEEKWISGLKEKYEIQINEEVLNQIIE